MKSKKAIASLLAIVMAVSSLAGCSGGAAGAAPANTAASSAAGGAGSKVTLTLWDYFEGVNSQRGVKSLVTAFNSSQNQVTVNAVFTPRDEMDKQLSIGLVSNKLPDLVLIDNPDFASRISMGLLADVSDNFKKDFEDKLDDFYPAPLTTCKFGDKYYGVPFGSNDLGLFYNKDMFKEAGIDKAPTTWDEMTADCKTLSKNGVYGMAVSAIKNDEGSFQFFPWLYSAGATYKTVNSAGGIKALSLMQNYINSGYLSKESINWTQADAEKQFATGKAAMMLNGPWNVETVKTDAPKMNFAIAQIPKDAQYASVTGGENLGIIKGHNEAAGWQFLKFTCDNALVYIDDMGYIPARKAQAAKDTKLSDPYMKPFVDILANAAPRGPEANWPKISAALYTAEQEVMVNQKSPADAAKEAQDSIDSALK
jgi:multiple sugar transport system substrate-binding protein